MAKSTYPPSGPRTPLEIWPYDQGLVTIGINHPGIDLIALTQKSDQPTARHS